LLDITLTSRRLTHVWTLQDLPNYRRPKVRYKGSSIEERDAVVERLREFLRFNYMTGAQAAQPGRRKT
jgi:hypothetical protein